MKVYKGWMKYWKILNKEIWKAGKKLLHSWCPSKLQLINSNITRAANSNNKNLRIGWYYSSNKNLRITPKKTRCCSWRWGCCCSWSFCGSVGGGSRWRTRARGPRWGPCSRAAPLGPETGAWAWTCGPVQCVSSPQWAPVLRPPSALLPASYNNIIIANEMK